MSSRRSYPESYRFRLCMPSSFPIKCGVRQHCLRHLFGFWGKSHYPLQIKRLPGPVTERRGYQRPPSMAINTTTTLDSFGLLDPPFLLYCKLKISQAEKYPDSREKRLHGKTFRIKSFRIQSSHFRFRIQNLWRHDQTGMFLFRIRPLVCKRKKPVRH